MVLFDTFEKAEYFWLYRDGETSFCGKNTDDFRKVLCAWNEMCSKARLLAPLAVGPSSVAEVEKMTHRGVWMEFMFNGTLSADGMSFDSLLVEVVPSAKGFNVIRHDMSREYAGRCFSVNLEEGDMSGVYEAVMNITKLF
ncbi:MAG: hypothetical protein LUD47_02740 [Clostridia bacterium]|nr:hypothetical protein [Clostridia bacterium]